MSRRAYFAGQGYLGSTAKISPFDSFEGGLNFRTLNPSGLLFYHNEGVCNSLPMLHVTQSVIQSQSFSHSGTVIQSHSVTVIQSLDSLHGFC